MGCGVGSGEVVLLALGLVLEVVVVLWEFDVELVVVVVVVVVGTANGSGRSGSAGATSGGSGTASMLEKIVGAGRGRAVAKLPMELLIGEVCPTEWELPCGGSCRFVRSTSLRWANVARWTTHTHTWEQAAATAARKATRMAKMKHQFL